MLIGRSLVFASMGVVLICGLARGAHAQGADYGAQGIALGSFLVFPSLTVDTIYRDNIFATDDNEVDDVVFSIAPQISLNSDWGRHALGVSAAANFSRYLDSTQEDTDNYSIAANGRLDIVRDTYLTADAGYQLTNEDRGSPDDANGNEPTEFTVGGGQLLFFNRFNRLWFELLGSARRLNFDDVGATGGRINNDDRDRVEYGSSVRVGYDLSPETALFVRAGYNKESYDQQRDDQGFERNSSGYDVVAGVKLEFTNLITGNIFGGAVREEFDDPRFNDETSYTVGAGVVWDVTQLTTVNLNASRRFEETTVPDASSALTTNAGFSVTHELLRNLGLDAGFSYRVEEFEGIDRDDDTIQANIGATYAMNRFFQFLLRYKYRQRMSDVGALDYTENSVSLGIRAQY